MPRRSLDPIRSLSVPSVAPALVAGAIALALWAIWGAPGSSKGAPGPGSDVGAVPVLTSREEGNAATGREAGLLVGLEAPERERIRRHLAAVEAEMRARDVSHLTHAQQETRARHLETLAEYRERGLFPRNLDFPGERVPYFVDDRGVHCAVGYLLHRSGMDELVERIAIMRNHARVPELADEPELVAWLEAAGITLEEAARIQPMYGGEGCLCIVGPEPEPQPRVTGYRAVSMGALALQGVSLGLNVAALVRGEPSGRRAILALGVGAGAMGLGVRGIGEPSTYGWGWANLGGGFLTLAAGLHAVRALRTDAGDARRGPFMEDTDEGADAGVPNARSSTTPPFLPRAAPPDGTDNAIWILKGESLDVVHSLASPL